MIFSSNDSRSAIQFNLNVKNSIAETDAEYDSLAQYQNYQQILGLADIDMLAHLL